MHVVSVWLRETKLGSEGHRGASLPGGGVVSEAEEAGM